MGIVSANHRLHHGGTQWLGWRQPSMARQPRYGRDDGRHMADITVILTKLYQMCGYDLCAYLCNIVDVECVCVLTQSWHIVCVMVTYAFTCAHDSFICVCWHAFTCARDSMFEFMTRLQVSISVCNLVKYVSAYYTWIHQPIQAAPWWDTVVRLKAAKHGKATKVRKGWWAAYGRYYRDIGKAALPTVCTRACLKWNIFFRINVFVGIIICVTW